MFIKKKNKITPYDKTLVRPVIHASICTGEQAAGFENLSTGRFEEVMLVKDRSGLERFMKQYYIKEEEIVTVY